MTNLRENSIFLFLLTFGPTNGLLVFTMQTDLNNTASYVLERTSFPLRFGFHPCSSQIDSSPPILRGAADRWIADSGGTRSTFHGSKR
jgi:hypothetical protein